MLRASRGRVLTWEKDNMVQILLRERRNDINEVVVSR